MAEDIVESSNTEDYPSWKVPCPECDTLYSRSPIVSHIYCPDCKIDFHQEW